MAESRLPGRKPRWNGKKVLEIVEVPVSDGDIITIDRIASSELRAQALKLGVDKGDLRANGVAVPTIAVWSHTAPQSVTVEVVGHKVRSMTLWNAWSHGGVDSSWIGSSGIVIEDDDSGRILRCSDGLGEATFDDLVVRVAIDRSS